MRKLEISLTEEQYQHIQEEIKYSNRVHLSCGRHIQLKTNTSIDLGEVEWEL